MMRKILTKSPVNPMNIPSHVTRRSSSAYTEFILESSQNLRTVLSTSTDFQLRKQNKKDF